MKKIVIAPDSFKGTLSSVEVCSIISEVIGKNYPDAKIKIFPVADGGEGTLEALSQSLKGKKIHLEVKSPLGRKIDAYYFLTNDNTAVIETALASGITIEVQNNALKASSYGTGQLIRSALENGAEKLIIGIGGSAMTDGGTGCLSALGARFYNSDGNPIEGCGENLERIKSIDLSDFDRRLHDCDITVLCDVKNPLYGKNGAAYIFAPRATACSYSSRMSVAAPSAITKPSRLLLKGRDAPLGSSLRTDRACIALKPPTPVGHIAASAPPAITTSARPRRIWS